MYLSAVAEKPEWATNYYLYVPKDLFPRLRDLPDRASSLKSIPKIADRMEKVLAFASLNPVSGPSKNSFISPHLADWLEQEPDPESSEVAEFIRDGIQLKTPSIPYPVTESAGRAPLEHDICTTNDLLKGCSVNAGYLGPIPYTGQTHAVVEVLGADGRKRFYKNKLNGTPVNRVEKRKKRMNYAGRLVTDLKRNLLNADYSFDERTIDFPSFQEQISTSRGQAYMFIVDFVAAYRQVRYHFNSWGLICILFKGQLFIDIALTFGWAPAAQKYQKFTRTLIRALCWYFPFIFLEKPSYIPHKPHIDDLKFVGSTFLVCERMRLKFKDIARRFDINLDFSPTNDTSVQEAIYCGWVHNLILQATRFPLPKRARLLRMLRAFLSGVPWFPLRGPRSKGLFKKREIAQVHGLLNHFSLGASQVYIKLSPLIRLMDGCDDDDFIQVSFVESPWLFRSMKEVLPIVEENAWIPFDTILKRVKSFNHYLQCFCDAAGVKDLDGTVNYGFGGISHTHNFAFQLPHAIYLPFLRSLVDSNPSPDHIMNAEHLVQVFGLWLMTEKLHLVEPHTILEMVTDNKAVYHWDMRGRCRYEAQSSLWESVRIMVAARACNFAVCWVGTDVMKSSGADDLSRKFCHKIYGVSVFRPSASVFEEFVHFILPQVFLYIGLS